ncbi:MAG: branched-chain amino acid ABC transporter permease [Desulfamplus sp.]|nr:branched-chain amino acid ABC transporter permease [Desulfamplus sp.]
MIQEFKKIWKQYAITMLWLLGILWPLLGIHPDGTLSFRQTFTVWSYILAGTFICFIFYIINKSGNFKLLTEPITNTSQKLNNSLQSMPSWIWKSALLFGALIYPIATGRYATDVAINVLLYVSLGLGLYVVVGLAGMLDLGHIAFYGVGAYTYAILNVKYGLGFWVCFPFAGLSACIAGCIVGYPTLKMRGDYLAIVTLGFGEIVRIILNNWMSLTNGPNGILGVKSVSLLRPVMENGFSFEVFWVTKLEIFYYFALGLAILTIVAVTRLGFSRIGRAWEAIREDETAAELMGVNTFYYKLLAYAMGAIFAGFAGALFAARMRFVSPESFTFLESVMLLCMVVLGGMNSIPGIILGVIALIALPEVFRGLESYRMLVFGSTMVIMMLFRPSGLIAAKRKKMMETKQPEERG